jgi:hypothetical protein
MFSCVDTCASPAAGCIQRLKSFLFGPEFIVIKEKDAAADDQAEQQGSGGRHAVSWLWCPQLLSTAQQACCRDWN